MAIMGYFRPSFFILLYSVTSRAARAHTLCCSLNALLKSWTSTASSALMGTTLSMSLEISYDRQAAVLCFPSFSFFGFRSDRFLPACPSPFFSCGRQNRPVYCKVIRSS
uniref:Putative secreted protein n=1 Tax=Ixodes ricinus TaxID=34613 RepID=A0A6B0UHC1_IXORI